MNTLEYNIEDELIEQGYLNVCGVDEAGRGPLCGPVCAAACILPTGLVIEGLNDSKKLTEKRREKLFEAIKEEAVAYSIAFATVEEINELKSWFEANQEKLPETMQIDSSAFSPDLRDTIDMLFEQAYICYENPKMQGCIRFLKKIKKNLEEGA
jgi:ribonuclease HII